MAKNYDDENLRRSGLTEREEETLPAWAQERMSGLRRQADTLGKNKPSRVAFGDPANHPIYLPDGPFDRIHIQLDDTPVTEQDGEYLQVASRKDPKSGVAYLEVSSNGPLAAVPQARNVIRLLPIERGDAE